MVQQHMETALQRLLQERLAGLEERWRECRAEQERLNTEASQLSEDIASLKEAVAVEARLSGQPAEPSANGTINLIGLGLRDAVALLQQTLPGITQAEIRRRLDEIRFDFKGKKPGNAINMALVSLRRPARVR